MSAKKTGLGKGLGAIFGDLAQDFPIEEPKKKKRISLEEELLSGDNSKKTEKTASESTTTKAGSRKSEATPLQSSETKGNANRRRAQGGEKTTATKNSTSKGTTASATASSASRTAGTRAGQANKTAQKPSTTTTTASALRNVAAEERSPEALSRTTTASGTLVEMIPISLIKRDPDQPRQVFNETALEELSASIQARGVIQPILAERVKGTYRIVAGERRYRAAKLAGLTAVPVIVKQLTDAERYEIAVVENVQREDLNAMEEARAYKTLLAKSGMSQVELAQQIGKNRSTIANSIRLLQLPNDMQLALERDDLSAGHARAILSIMNPADQRVLFKKIMKKGLSVREAEALAAALNEGSRASQSSLAKRKVLDPMLEDMEQRMMQQLGTRVSLKGGLKKGKIEISYYNAEDLDRIYNLFLTEGTEEYHID